MTPDAKRKQIADRRAAARTTKIGRDAFLYMEDHDGDGGDDDFAQCSDCRFFDGGSEFGTCAVIGRAVQAGWSCGLFVDGTFDEGIAVQKNVTEEEAGLVKRQVRCENCKFGGKTCALYERLNDELPQLFDLDTKIHPKGCCNANTPA